MGAAILYPVEVKAVQAPFCLILRNKRKKLYILIPKTSLLQEWTMKRPLLKKNRYKTYLPYLENLGLPKAVHKKGHKTLKHQSQSLESSAPITVL